jgi:hypothetical protein
MNLFNFFFLSVTSLYNIYMKRISFVPLRNGIYLHVRSAEETRAGIVANKRGQYSDCGGGGEGSRFEN